MGAAQVVDSLRGSASAPIGWARRPPRGAHTREHAWTERPIPPPARDACDQIAQNRPTPPGRTRPRTPPPARTFLRRLLAPLRQRSSSGPSVLAGPRPRGRTTGTSGALLIRNQAVHSPTRIVGLASRLSVRPGRSPSPRRCLRLRPTAPPASRVQRPRLPVRHQERASRLTRARDLRQSRRRRPPRSLEAGAQRTLGNRIAQGRSQRLDRRSRSRVGRTEGIWARRPRTRRSDGVPRFGAGRILGHT